MKPLKLWWQLARCLSLLLVAGCTALQIGSNIQKGRAELMIGDSKVALAHFEKAAELNPDYILDFSQLPQGVWTYVGRAYYAQGQFPQARKAFEQARSRHHKDNLAKLYLGLVLARNGDRRKGLREIETGLRGLGEWLDDLDQNHPDGQFWDPGRDLRNEIQRHLAMISGRDINWAGLISSVEWLGREFEEEIDRAREDKFDDLFRDSDDDGGMN